MSCSDRPLQHCEVCSLTKCRHLDALAEARAAGRREYQAYIISELRNRADTKVNALPAERQAWRTVARWIEEGCP